MEETATFSAGVVGANNNNNNQLSFVYD